MAGAATELVRGWLASSPEIARRLLSSRFALSRKQIAALGSDATSLSKNPELAWHELLEDPTVPVDWRLLSSNRGRFWTRALLDKYARRWDFGLLSKNPALPWSVELISAFEPRWSWLELSANPGLEWSAELLAAFRGRWVWSRVAANPAVRWDATLLSRHRSELDAIDPEFRPHERPKQIAPGVTLCETGWHHLQQNRSAVWSEILPLIPRPVWSLLSRNPALPWSKLFLVEHEHEIDFGCLAVNGAVPWDLGLIDRHADQLGWLQLAANPALPWSDELLRRFESHAESVWKRLSGNSGARWTPRQLSAHRHSLDWSAISSSAALEEDTIETFADRLDFEAGLPVNRRLPWSARLIERWRDQWSWSCLGTNPALPWSTGLLLRFGDRWQLESFGQNDVGWALLRPLFAEVLADLG